MPGNPPEMITEGCERSNARGRRSRRRPACEAWSEIKTQAACEIIRTDSQQNVRRAPSPRTHARPSRSQGLIGASEAETFWTAFLPTLTRRGLRGDKLVISDAHEGLKTAVAKVLQPPGSAAKSGFSDHSLVGPEHKNGDSADASL
jgi:hypothetical protein